MQPPSIACLLVLAALLLPCRVPAAETITWLVPEMPPLFITEGPDRGKGYGDAILAILEASLPQYQHEVAFTNVVKHFDRFRQGDNVCAVGLFKTAERQDFIRFTLPSLIGLPTMLIIKKDRQAAFGNKSVVKLGDILADTGLSLGLGQDRSYGASIDAVIGKHAGRDNLIVFSGQELQQNYFKMLMLNRVDGLIGLPEEALYQATRLGIRDQVMTVGIEENQGDADSWMAYAGCSRTAWGERVVEDINRVLLQERPSGRYRAAYLQWLDANSAQIYHKVYEEVFLATQ
jgi:uncharacterized protein (TIGR02285 family)